MRTPSLVALAALALVGSGSLSGCGDDDGSSGDSAEATDPVDADGDGYRAATDCDDEDPSAHPGASESCDGIDNDCDGKTDEDSSIDAITWYLDDDGDGYGDADADTEVACEQPSGYVSSKGDCDDQDAGASPALPEECADGIDNDCDGQIDEEADGDDSWTWYLDADGDGYGDAAATMSGCTAGSSYVADATDCDDSDEDVNPSATELCNGVDDNCDGVTDDDGADRASWYLDADGDGYGDAEQITISCEVPDGSVANDDDCDDDRADVNPGAAEICDEIDDDCDGETDEGLTLVVWIDGDGDGYGDPDTSSTVCEVPDGAVLNDDDCDDADLNVSPEGAEVCDGIDNDCDGDIDGSDASDATAWYADSDDDGYGNVDAVIFACTTDSPSGYVLDDSDCDDDDPYIRPDAREFCDDVDNDCDGETDEASSVDARRWYLDGDGDGYGVATKVSKACYSAPDGYASSFTDCDDDDATINPGVAELCDDVDNDCDGTVDDGVKDTYYRDNDADGYGDADRSTDSCAEPSGYVLNNTDCDDESGDTYPSAAEICDGVMNDCDSAAVPDDETDDDGDGYVECDVWYGSSGLAAGDCDDDDKKVYPGVARYESALCTQDGDGDGWGDSTVSGGLDAGTDCDDDDDSVYPGLAVEEPTLCTRDEDGDGWGDIDAGGALEPGTDCDDSSSSIHPEAAENEPDLCTRDRDGDGWGDQDVDAGVDEGSDCDDRDDEISPDAVELCDYVDNNCDGEEDESTAKDATTWYADEDDDDYGDKTNTQAQCFSAPTGYVSNKTDCDDTDDTIYPGATETCNSADDDCDNSIDEGVTTVFYKDSDSDGYGDSATTTSACTAPSKYVSNSTDCDDSTNKTYPGATEQCDDDDNDCDGLSDEGILGHSKSCSATSCEEIYDDDYGSDIGDGNYYIDWNGTATSTYCLMDHDEGGGWTRVTYLDFASSSSYNCDPGSTSEWSNTTAYSSFGIAKLCYIDKDSHSDGIATRVFDVGGLSFNEVLGYVEGYQYGSPDAFDGGKDALGTPYTDGLSITLENPATNADHIFTYAVGLYKTKNSDSSCPDSLTGNGGDEPPDWVGSNYDCESGNSDSDYDDTLYTTVLFEDEYFYVTLDKSTTTDIQADLMQDESNSNEHFYLSKFVLYIR